jgi:hypothetical protein
MKEEEGKKDGKTPPATKFQPRVIPPVRVTNKENEAVF